MIALIINVCKIVFLLGFLILIHEGGHFLVAKLCKVKVNEFAIGFGPTIWKKQGKETKYAIRLIPLGGFVSMEGEDEESESANSFSKASIPKRIAIVAAGAIVNIVFGLLIYFVLIAILYGSVSIALEATQAVGLANFIYLLSVVSVSLGVTNFLPIPALDGGKILLLIIEAIRRKPMKQETEAQIQLIGFSILIALSIVVTYNDLIRI